MKIETICKIIDLLVDDMQDQINVLHVGSFWLNLQLYDLISILSEQLPSGSNEAFYYLFGKMEEKGNCKATKHHEFHGVWIERI